MRILTVVGNRPQFIKAAALSDVLKSAGIDELLLHTGQHYDRNMSQVFFDELSIPSPWRALESGSGSHATQTAKMMVGIEAAILDAKPDLVLLYGDTNSTLAGALTAAKMHHEIAHVEAGLRSFDRSMPEEINRIVTDHLSTLMFTPSAEATANLHNEGRPHAGIHLVGDVMFDIALRAADLVRDRHTTGSGPYVLVTIHRADNTDDHERLRSIVNALLALVDTMRVVFPIHPRTLSALHETGLYARLAQKVEVSEPLGFLEMTALECGASVILTDSGGVQREAFFHGVPSVVVRDSTEWVELIELGWAQLVSPAKSSDIVDATVAAVGTTGTSRDLYGNGRAAEAICGILLQKRW